jgi:hypothetical protein
MAEAQNLGINLDPKSIDILKKVDAIHRDSLINIAIALVSKTGYYKTLTGIDAPEDLDEVASLEVELDEESTGSSSKPTKKSKKTEAPAKKPATSWDAF